MFEQIILAILLFLLRLPGDITLLSFTSRLSGVYNGKMLKMKNLFQPLYPFTLSFVFILKLKKQKNN